jgi:hypothetical protein
MGNLRGRWQVAANTGAEAEWAGLDRQAQKEVKRNARRLRPHPDPAVSAIAARYARDVLDRTSQTTLLIRFAIPAVAFFILTQIGSGLDPHGTALAVYLVVLVVAFIVAAVFAVRAYLGLQRRKLFTRVKMANWLAPGAETARTEPPAEQSPADGGTLAVRYVPRKLIRQLAIVAAVACVAVAVLALQLIQSYNGLGVVEIPIMIVVGLLFLYSLGAQVWALARWAFPGRPIVELAEDGVHLNVIGVAVPWSAISEVGRFSVRGRSCDVIAFVCADPAVLLSQARLSWLRRWMLNRSARVYGTPFTIADALTDQTADRIAATASARAGVDLVRH